MGDRPTRLLLVACSIQDAGEIVRILAHGECGAFEFTHIGGAAELESGLTTGSPDAIVVDLSRASSQDAAMLVELRGRLSEAPVPMIVLTDQDGDLFKLRAHHPDAAEVLVKGRIDQGALPRALYNAFTRQAAEANLRRIIATNPDGIIVVNDDGVVMFANPAASALFDLLLAALIDQDFGHPIVGGGTVEVDVGGERVAEMRVVEIVWHNRPAYLTSLRDITEHKRIERRLEDARREADNRTRTKSEFVAYMSHELRTPLNSILGFSEMIKNELLGPVGIDDYRDYADAIHSSGRHLLGIINDVLDLAAVEAGRLELQEDLFDPADVVRAALRMVGGFARDRRITLIDRLAPELPLVCADQRRIQQCLNNLLTNGVKYTPAGGGVTVEGSVDPADQALVLTVTDTGHGIPAHELAGLMMPYRRVGDAVSRSQQGTGLGLFVTRTLIERHGGTLSLTSELGQGTRVTISLPAARTRPRRG